MTFDTYQAKILGWQYNTSPDTIHNEIREIVTWSMKYDVESDLQNILTNMKEKKMMFLAEQQNAISTEIAFPQAPATQADLQR